MSFGRSSGVSRICCASAVALALVSTSRAAAAAIDFTLVPAARGGTYTLYALDAETGHVSFTDVPASGVTSIDLDALTGLRFPASVRAVAIAARWNRLLFIDRGVSPPVVREFDPQTSAIYDVSSEIPLSEPIALAAAPTGEIAIADAERRATIWIDERAHARAVTWPEGVTRVTQLAFDERVLRAIDASTGRILELPRPTTPEQARRAAAPVSNLSPVRAFDVRRGVVYGVGETGLFAVAAGEGRMRVPCTQCPPAIAGVRALANQLVLYDERNRRFVLMPRPVPVGVSIEASLAQGQQVVGALYAYLAERSLLATRAFTAPRAFATAADALRSQRAIPALASGSGGTLPAGLTDALCRLNADWCQAARDWNRPLAAGTSLTIPDYDVTSFVHTDFVDLNGTSVAERIRPIGAIEPDATRVEYLRELNSQSFEDTLAQHDLVVASPASADWRPGAVIVVSNGVEHLDTGLDRACGAPLAVADEPAPLDIPDRVSRSTTKDFVPLATDTDGHPKEIVGQGNQPFTMSFRTTRLEYIDLVASIQRNPNLSRCLAQLGREATAAAANRLVVVQALRVEGALYAFQAPARPHIFEQPYYIAYAAVPLAAFATQSTVDALTQTLRPDIAKPGGPQDILNRTNGTVQLPTVGWSLTALVPAGDLADRDSPLHAIEHGVDGRVLFLSHEVIARSAASIATQTPDDAPQALDQAAIDAMTAERQQLLKVVGYGDLERERVAPVRIGIGEAGIDFDHPAMFESRSGALVSAFWTQNGPDDPFVPHIVGTPTAQKAQRRKFSPADHGVHVAGLLAARQSSVLPGFLPNAELFVIDTTMVNADSLRKSIAQAVRQGVRVFNFSLTFEQNITEQLKLQIQKDLAGPFQRQLFVVAAGDHACDLSDPICAVPPIAWVKDQSRHMIGVGTTTPDGAAYETKFSEGIGQTEVSAWSNQHVQLAVPGRGIFSLARDNAYADATGTSQAAPQVTAAAALLAQQTEYNADQIKARLIYTADWIEGSENYLWGGRLNVRRAVWSPSKSLFIDRGDLDAPPIAVEFDPSMTVTLGGNDRRMIEHADPDTSPATPPNSLPLVDVLRLTSLSNGLFRVHFLDRNNHNQLRIVENAEVHGAVTFWTMAQWSREKRDFVPLSTNVNGVDIGDLMFDYVSRIPNPCETVVDASCKPTIIF